MKKILVFTLCVGLLVGTQPRVKPIGKLTTIGGTIVSAAAFGALGYMAMKYVEKKYPEYTTEKKKKIVRILVTALCAGAGGGLAYLILSEYTADGRIARSQKMIDEVERDSLVGGLTQTEQARQVTIDFIADTFPTNTPLADAIYRCHCLKQQIRRAEHFMRLAQEDDSRVTGLDGLRQKIVQLKQRIDGVREGVRGMEGYTQQIERTMCREWELREYSEISFGQALANFIFRR